MLQLGDRCLATQKGIFYPGFSVFFFLIVSDFFRAKFLTHLVNGVKHILQNPQGLSDPANYHEFCRLLARLKSNYQLGELVMVDNYPEAIQLIAKFTVSF